MSLYLIYNSFSRTLEFSPKVFWQIFTYNTFPKGKKLIWLFQPVFNFFMYGKKGYFIIFNFIYRVRRFKYCSKQNLLLIFSSNIQNSESQNESENRAPARPVRRMRNVAKSQNQSHVNETSKEKFHRHRKFYFFFAGIRDRRPKIIWLVEIKKNIQTKKTFNFNVCRCLKNVTFYYYPYVYSDKFLESSLL